MHTVHFFFRSVNLMKALFICLVFPLIGYTQRATTIVDSTNPAYRTVIAGSQYKAGGLKKTIWGKHYRNEWTIPVKVPVMLIDTARGGLVPVEKGGGRQTKTLRLKNPQGKEFVLRSIDKTLEATLPEIAHGTFIQDIINDQASIAHPYAAITVAPLAEIAGIYHTNPQIVFVPNSAALGEYNNEFGNRLYLFEERPDDDQRDAAFFGNSKEVVSSDKMLEKVLEENDHMVDQEFFIRARLFDMFIGDWGRHEDQWRWATIEVGDEKVYRAIPRDRDQVYTLFDGLLVKPLASFAQKGVQSFGPKIKDVPSYNFPARYLDHRFTNEEPLETWTTIAKDLQARLTDAEIESAVKRLPPEIFPISGQRIIDNLKARRNNLVSYAEAYYKFLAREVDIVGTKEKEIFDVHSQPDGKMKVNVFRRENDSTRGKYLYERVFDPAETKEVRLYGVGGADRFQIAGEADKSIKLRIIGGPEKDEYTTMGNTSSLFVYDDADNAVATLPTASLTTRDDTTVHIYDYKAFRYDNSGIKASISYNNRDRIFLQTGYYIEKQKWRKSPFGYRHDFNINYSLTQGAFNFEYIGRIVEAVGKWNIDIGGEYDFVRDYTYYGIGNDVPFTNDTRQFYRLASKEVNGLLGLSRSLGRNQQVGVHAYYQGFQVEDESEKFISTIPVDETTYEYRHYAGLRGNYAYMKLDHNAIPHRGFGFISEASVTQPLDNSSEGFARIGASAGIYIPLLRNLVLASKAGGETMTSSNQPFYQLNRLGGAATFRGYSRWRYFGQHAFYNNNELQWTFPFRSYIMNGTAGLLLLYDNGRVWHPGDTFDNWHHTFGAGIMLAPFDKATLVITYADGKDDARINIRLGRLF